MPRGRLIFWRYCEIAPYDPAAMGTAARFDDDYREPLKTDTDGDGIGEDNRLEKPIITLRAQIERDREELQRMTRAGNIPDAAVGLVVHMRDLERGDGTTSYVDADGEIAVPRINDRLVRTLDRQGVVTNTYTDPKLYCIHRRRLHSFGRASNLALLLFGDRPQGLT